MIAVVSLFVESRSVSDKPLCLVVDASCDVPLTLLAHPQVKILPVRVVVGDKTYLDRRQQSAISAFYAESLSSVYAVSGRSEPLSDDEMTNAFSDQIALQFDEAIGVFVSSTRSAIYTKAKGALSKSRVTSFHQRLQAGIKTPLSVACLDSLALFAGYAAQALDLVDLMNSGGRYEQVLARQALMAHKTYAYMAPGDVSYILERASLKGEKSVSALAGFAAKSLGIIPVIRGYRGETAPVARKFGKVKAQTALIQMATALVTRKLLLAPHICFSYSGDLKFQHCPISSIFRAWPPRMASWCTCHRCPSPGRSTWAPRPWCWAFWLTRMTPSN